MLSFNSRDKIYKSHLGAVEKETELQFSVLLARDTLISEPVMIIRHDNRSDPSDIIMHEKEKYDEDYSFYSCSFIPDQTGIYWYHFAFETQDGRRELKRKHGGAGEINFHGEFWQQTVYEKGFKTPDWLAGGLIYQIFPDRFAGFMTKKENMPEDRYYHEDWYATPAFQQDSGKYTLGNDYYGGDLKGIEKKLPYLNRLGVTCIYLNPIFEAHSNHRYNTADYMRIDPLLGTKEDFISLCNQAHSFGMRVILDGVFSHTGSDSRYFNRENRYKDLGAYQSKESDYYPWYDFQNWPDQYRCWWGIDTLPEVDEQSKSFTEFITGENGVLRTWLRAGADGWRLDVADELPDEFIKKIRSAVKEENREAFLLGEVWEDASNKYSYGCRRQFLMGEELDSVMNYLFKDEIIKFLNGGNSDDLMECVLNVCENYPPQVIRVLMNHIGTHDTERIITALAGEKVNGRDRIWMSTQRLTKEQYKKGVRFLKLASMLQYTLPGVPSLYYGDEAGMQGYRDPFNRGGYPWGKEDRELIAWYQMLGNLRAACPAFDGGEFFPVYSGSGHIAYIRKKGNNEILVSVNRWCDPEPVQVPESFIGARVLIGTAPKEGVLMVPAEGVSVLSVGNWADDFELAEV